MNKLQDVSVPPAAPLGVMGFSFQIQPLIQPIPAGFAMLQQDELSPGPAHRCHLLHHTRNLRSAAKLAYKQVHDIQTWYGPIANEQAARNHSRTSSLLGQHTAAICCSHYVK